MRVTFVSLVCVFLVLFPAFVTPGVAQSLASSAETIALPIDLADPLLATQTAAPPPVAVEYSDGYRLRARIHKISSFATLPLFGAEAIVGQSLYSEPTQGKKDAHLAIAAGIGALFAVETATGVWNLIEARKDPVHRGRRLAHGLMMLGADAGFLATAALGPESEHGRAEGSRATHRAVAFTSIGLATAGYLIMLFGGN
jgi:hypothetical protein